MNYMQTNRASGLAVAGVVVAGLFIVISGGIVVHEHSRTTQYIKDLEAEVTRLAFVNASLETELTLSAPQPDRISNSNSSQAIPTPQVADAVQASAIRQERDRLAREVARLHGRVFLLEHNEQLDASYRAHLRSAGLANRIEHVPVGSR